MTIGQYSYELMKKIDRADRNLDSFLLDYLGSDELGQTWNRYRPSGYLKYYRQSPAAKLESDHLESMKKKMMRQLIIDLQSGQPSEN